MSALAIFIMKISSNGNISALLALCVGIHRSPVNSPNKGQWPGALMISLICAWTNGWSNNRDAGDLRRYGAHYCVTVMTTLEIIESGLAVYYWCNSCKLLWHDRHFASTVTTSVIVIHGSSTASLAGDVLLWNHSAPDDAIHSSDVTPASWCLKTPATRVFVPQPIQTHSNGDTPKLRVSGFLWGEPPAPGGFPHKEPLMREKSPCHDVIMKIALDLFFISRHSQC